MVVVAQLVRVLVCGAEGRRFEPGQPPRMPKASKKFEAFFVEYSEGVTFFFAFEELFFIVENLSERNSG